MDHLLPKEYLDSSIQDARKDVLVTGGDSQRVAILGIALQKRFLATYSQRDLDDGLETLQDAFVESEDGSSQIPAILNSCSILVQMRAANEDHLEDTLIAVALAQTAVELCVDEDLNKWYCKLQLCKAQTLAHELDPHQDRTKSVLAMLDQLLVDPPDRTVMHLGQSVKAYALRVLYKWTGDDELINDFINSDFDINTCHTEIAKSLVAQNNAESYLAAFDRGGNSVKIAIAQGFLKTALQWFRNVHAPGTHPYEALLLRLRGSVASRIFSTTHIHPHIEAAKKHFRSALQLMGPANIFRTKTITDFVLSVQLSAMNQPQTQLSNSLDLAAARKVLKVELKRSDLSISQRRKFCYLLQENHYASAGFGLQGHEAKSAEGAYSQELELDFLTDPDMLTMNINRMMDNIWGWKTFTDENYAMYKSLALRYEKVVMGPSPKSKNWNPSNKLFLSGLKVAAALLLKLFFSRQEKDIGIKAIHVCAKIVVNPCFDAARRLWAGTMAAICFFKCLDEIDHSTKTCIDIACMLMPQAIPIGLRRVDQLILIRKLHYTPKLAASIYIAAREPLVNTTTVLEEGRSVIWEQLMKRRLPFERFEKMDIDLATRWKQLQQDAAAAEQSRIPSSILQDPLILQARQKDLNEDVRKSRWAHLFFQKFEEVELKALAKHGSLVMLNVTELRSDAIVICADGLHTVHLPMAEQEKCREQHTNLKHALKILEDDNAPQNQWNFSDESIHKVLLWLWTAIAQPIIASPPISIQSCPEGQRPRIWWVTSSWANLLPLHAAGDHKRAAATGEPCSLLDLTESSYTPTLRALREARKRMKEFPSRRAEQPQEALLVAMRTTPDRRSLPETMTEIDTVGSVINNHFNTRILREPHTSEVVNHLKRCTIAHIASHGETDGFDPMKSQLLFQDHGKATMSVQTLSDTQFPDCQLVYLSACETTVNQDADLLDEGIHVSGGFQMAGVPNTISTWWTVLDGECVGIAKAFYQGLVTAEMDIDVSRCAKSLRAAMLQLRDAGKSPLIWAAYSHSGV